MPRKPKPAAARDEQSLDGFAQQIEIALEHCSDPQWLGENSMLAAPFVLGRPFGEPLDESPRSRGGALLLLLQRSVEQLPMEEAAVLTDLYLQRNRRLNNRALAMKRNMSERTFYRWRQQAIVNLANTVHTALLPPLRVEQPPVRPMVGRTEILKACWRSIDSAQSVYVSGQSGVGKTLFAANIYNLWTRARLWYTVRPGLTDRLPAFLFALGHFLRGLGAANTWRQLVADNGVVQTDRIMSVIRYDLAQLQTAPLLLCVDEVDALTPERSEHARFLHVLDELRTEVRLLLLGQRVVMEADTHHVLSGFNADELDEWLALLGAGGLAAADRKRLLHVTNGHPALLSLLSSLQGSGEDIAGVIPTANSSLSLEMLLARIWRKLDDLERNILAEIAVFGAAAPLDLWRHAQPLVSRLADKKLVNLDQQGGVECDPHLAPLIYDRIAADVRIAMHLQAATALEQRGEFLRAMQHYVKARRPDQAVWLWFRQREQQIGRGQGPVALGILDQIVSADLPHAEDRTALALARAELLDLMGEVEPVIQALGSLPLQRTGVAAAYAQQLLGDAQERQGQIEQALASYRRSLETLAGSIPFRQVVGHRKLVYLHLTRVRDLAAARREAVQALFHAQTYAATVDELSGNLEGARAQYEQAIATAEGTENNSHMLALGYSQLGTLLLKLGELESAVDFLQRGRQLSELRGDSVGPLSDRINLAYAMLLLGRYNEAKQLAGEGLIIAERMRHAHMIAGLAAALADTLYHIGDIDAAEQHVTRSLMQEEEFFRSWALTVLGWIQAARSEFAVACSTLQMAVELAQQQEDEYGEAYALLAMGEVCCQACNRGQAYTHFAQALRLYTKLGAVFEARRVQERIAAFGLVESGERTLGSRQE